jgi:hypothetical protein
MLAFKTTQTALFDIFYIENGKIVSELDFVVVVHGLLSIDHVFVIAHIFTQNIKTLIALAKKEYHGYDTYQNSQLNHRAR